MRKLAMLLGSLLPLQDGAAVLLADLDATSLETLAHQAPATVATRRLMVSYDTCPASLDVDATVHVRYPVTVEYAVPSSALAVSRESGSVVLKGGSPSIRSRALTEVFADDESSALKLNAASMRVVTAGIFDDMPQVAEHVAASSSDAQLLRSLETSLDESMAAHLAGNLDDETVTVSTSLTPDVQESPLPDLELCEDSTLKVTVESPAPAGKESLGRGAYPVKGSPTASLVLEYLKNEDGETIAFRSRREVSGVPVGRIGVTPTDASVVPLADGRYGIRIVGGTPVAPGLMPWAVAFATESAGGTLQNYCGGTLIDKHWVLTAAHCLVTDDSVAILGRTEINGDDGEVREIETAWRHIDFNESSGAMYDFDIALVKLKSPTQIAPVNLINVTLPNVETVTAIGWGAKRSGGQPIETLHSVELQTVPLSTCKFNYRQHRSKVTDNMICASEPDKDTCQGDSGGGLFYTPAADSTFVAGIVSFGEGCAEANFPGVYTDVSKFRTWVEAVSSANNISSNP